MGIFLGSYHNLSRPKRSDIECVILEGSSLFSSVGEITTSVVKLETGHPWRAQRAIFPRDLTLLHPKTQNFSGFHGPWDGHGHILRSSGAKSLPIFLCQLFLTVGPKCTAQASGTAARGRGICGCRRRRGSPAARWATALGSVTRIRGRLVYPRGVRGWWGGHAAYYGRVGPRWVRMVRRTVRRTVRLPARSY